MDVLEQSLKKAFMNKEIEGSHYDPKLIINRPKEKEFLLNVLQEEIDTCEDFFFSVAFVTQDGLNALKSHLSDLADRGISGRLLTSTYLGFNHPDMFKALLAIPNLEVRISAKSGFHSKGYLFSQKDYHSFIIGSSNLTMSALKLNYEWNIRLTSYEHGEVIHQIQNHLTSEWEQAEALTPEWVTEYRANYEPVVNNQKLANAVNVAEVASQYVMANRMQKVALKNLKELRETGAKKGLVISATGTGKTYLAAFDVANVQPKRMLFIVHREQILNKTKESFEKVLGEPSDQFGILSGSQKDTDAKYLFATIQTISKPAYQELFEQDYFDYILIDEVHKAGAQSYLQTLNYFTPKFLLGMTATPERTDNFNIFELFDYNIAYEIRLQEALEEDLLCPFHYFGVTDFEKEDVVISETTDLKYLTMDDRVKFLIEKIHYYGCSGNDPKGLVFCSRKEEARELSERFNQREIPSTYLTGEHSIDEREAQIERLESGELNYIFTVDIFNEGIDIPKINQVVMLRNTQSSIIFVQQLGRGLRKDDSKEFVTIIDFIGNYKNNYMIPMALSGDITRNKDNLRKDTFDTNYISGLSTINFEEVAKERIFKSIDDAALDSMKELKQIYSSFKNRLNRIPYLTDFMQQQVLDPMLIANKFDSYYTFLAKVKDNEDTLAEQENKFLMFLSREILPGIRQHEIILLSKLLKEKCGLTFKEVKDTFTKSQLPDDDETIQSVLRTLSLEFYTGGQKKTYSGAELISVDNSQLIQLSPAFQQALQKDYFRKLLEDLLTASFYKSEDFATDQALTRYAKYRRRDVLRMLNWHEQMVDQNIGGYTYKDGKFIIFITLQKGEDFKGAQMAYEDELIDEATMRWFTKSPRTLASPEVKALQDAKSWTIHLFVKKSDDEGKEFYYLGEASPIQDTIKQLSKPTQEGKAQNVVEMDLRLAEAVDTKLFKYLT
ncbi:DUF3427 domain-containing protein [Enterococcus sp. AZ163]|uniref:DUF3427 domain-containing protein n=1 Tax=Enterococcus sp. AZ163 TaxID=2774638 RepID=UPI003D27B6C0